MSHGYPDWGTGGPLITVHSVQDLGEMAARLKSIDTFDRRGNVLCLDDFDSGIEAWTIFGLPVGYTGVWSPVSHRNGGFSLKLTTENDEDGYVEAQKGFPYPYATRQGVEFSFIHGEYVRDLEIRIATLDGSYQSRCGVRWIRATKLWQYLDTDGVTWENLTLIRDLAKFDNVFHTVKLVVDMTTWKYVRLIVNDLTFPLSDFSAEKFGNDDAAMTYAYFRVTAESDDYAYTYIDDFIATINEP